IESENETEFIEKLILLYKNADLRLEMGEKGHQFVMKEFESKVVGEKFTKIFSSL
ncbi:MAG: hypothetical protein HUU45_14405, partial [Leptospiraceae bacterium]|nr:hypothetical protein [Leptospiraceae bacterium]